MLFQLQNVSYDIKFCTILYYNYAAISTGAFGVLAGALVIYFAKSNPRTVAMINWIAILIAAPTLLVYLIRCPSVQLAGVNVPFADG